MPVSKVTRGRPPIRGLKTYGVRFQKSDIEAAKRLAQARGTSMHALLREWVSDAVKRSALAR